jgi:hypothetical protein
MDLIIVIVCCNCVIAIVVMAIALWTIRFRRQVVAIAECCDLWEGDCTRLLSQSPASLVTSRTQILDLRQIYQQQLSTLDRLQALMSLFWFARSLLNRRRRLKRL